MRRDDPDRGQATPSYQRKIQMTRRDLLKLSTAAAAAAAFRSPASGATPYSMPGLFPARVVAVKHSGASVNMVQQTGPIQLMVRSGIAALTGQSSYIAGWRKLFQPGDVVVIKVNPSWYPQTSTCPTLLLEVINGLLLAGVSPKSIIVYERYQYLLGFLTPFLPPWVTTAFVAPGYYVDDQTPLFQGLTNTLGYDPQYYVNLPQYLEPWQSASNPADTCSHVAKILTTVATKIISLAQLKDHQASGVTLNLKNLSAGCVNNWNRFHDNGINVMDPVIPTVVSLPVLRNKVTLGIIDGINCLCDGGPLNYADPAYGFVSSLNTILMATDVVAADRVGWVMIDAERAKKGLPLEAVAGNDGYDLYTDREVGHITTAGQMGLGECRDAYINQETITLA
jgi:hypothetical protein